jgi:hypothetical protein
MEQKVTSTVTKGFVIALVMIVISLGIYFAGLAFDKYVKWLTYIVFILGVVIAIKQYGQQIDYNSTFGNYFAHGFKVSALVTIMMIAYSVIFFSAFPDFKQQALDAARNEMQSDKNISQETLEKSLELTKRFFMIGVVGSVLFFYLITGAVASLIGAAITKKDPRLLQD